jgi:hypothetical protein
MDAAMMLETSCKGTGKGERVVREDGKVTKPRASLSQT